MIPQSMNPSLSTVFIDGASCLKVRRGAAKEPNCDEVSSVLIGFGIEARYFATMEFSK